MLTVTPRGQMLTFASVPHPTRLLDRSFLSPVLAVSQRPMPSLSDGLPLRGHAPAKARAARGLPGSVLRTVKHLWSSGYDVSLTR